RDGRLARPAVRRPGGDDRLSTGEASEMTTALLFVTIEFQNELKTYDNHATHTARWSSVVRHRYRSNSIGSPGKVASQSSGHGTRGGKLDGSAHRRHGRLVPVPNVWLRSHGDVEGD